MQLSLRMTSYSWPSPILTLWFWCSYCSWSGSWMAAHAQGNPAHPPGHHHRTAHGRTRILLGLRMVGEHCRNLETSHTGSLEQDDINTFITLRDINGLNYKSRVSTYLAGAILSCISNFLLIFALVSASP